MTGRPASLRRSLLLHLALPRGGLLLGWGAANQLVKLPLPLAWGLIAADALFFLWQCRAFLRSADAHTRDTGNLAPVWGGYLAVLFAAFAAATLWWDAVLISSHEDGTPYAVQRAREREALYSLALAPGGEVLVFDGEITHGLTRRLRQLLAENPDVTQLQLSGTGGLVYEARGAANLVRARGLETRAGGLCASACTLVFAGGSRRSLDAGGQLGFHGYALMFEGGLPQVDLLREQEKDRAFLLAQGVSAGLAGRIFAVPNSGLWLPDHAELLSGGMITP
ncbi:hypothetical protein [Cribrihabitans pelagius]|uniref:COG3904 family protein n=1 Tax=Cribrihabitans pelagius TaxID=1765746 RepID=UPI003B5CF933